MQVLKFLFKKLSVTNTAEFSGETAGQLPGAPTYKRHYDVTGIIGSMVLVNSGVLMRKNFSENYPQFGPRPQKYSPALG